MKTTNRFHRRCSRRGIITALVAVSLVAVLMIAALSIDGGRMVDLRRQAKAAADAAARGAAVEMLDMASGTNSTVTLNTIRATAFRLAADNGFNNDGATSIVTVNTPPTSGSYAGMDGYIEVIIEAHLDRGFSRLLGSNQLSVVGRSVGAGTYAPTKGSVLVLNRKKKNALSLGHGSSALFVDGDIAVNTTNKQPISIERGSQIHATNIILSSTLDKNRGRDLLKHITGQMSTRAPATQDPFNGLPLPTPGTDRKLSDYKTAVSSGTETYNLQPGHYTEDWNFDHSDTVNLAPGVYYLDKKRIDVHDGASMYGDGVTIYSAGNNELRFHSQGTIHLTPPTSGSYAGISLFKDPTSHGKITFEKDANLDINGVIYAPSSMIRFQKTSTTLGDDSDTSAWDNLDSSLDDALTGDLTSGDGSIGASLIADMIKVDDNSTIRISGQALNLQRPILGLVE
jgi:hypothetical protein